MGSNQEMTDTLGHLVSLLSILVWPTITILGLTVQYYTINHSVRLNGSSVQL